MKYNKKCSFRRKMEEERKKTEQKVEVEYIQVNFHCVILRSNIYILAGYLVSEFSKYEFKVQIFVLGVFFSFKIVFSKFADLNLI